MRIKLDTDAELLVLDGVKISLELLKTLVTPDPRVTYRLRRREDEVIVMEAIDGQG